MDIQLDELFGDVEGSQVLIAVDALWAEVEVDIEEETVALDGLYICKNYKSHTPLFHQSKTLNVKEYGYLFDAAEAYLESNRARLVLEAYENDNGDDDSAYENQRANKIMEAAE